MSDSEAALTQADLAALKALQADTSELECLESLLDRFNVFETIVRFDKDEVMHSDFLASLLDPKRTGVLGVLLITEVLRETLATARETLPSSAFAGLDRVLDDLDSMDLSQTLVRREHQYIDVLLTNEDHKLAVIIENKIWASEGPGQLDWYDRIIRHTYPGWDVHRIYLTPFGGSPSLGTYVPFSYGALCDIVDRVSEYEGSVLDPEVSVPAKHYARMVRRRILGDPETVRLAQSLYQKHKRAFDFVHSHRPDVRAQIKEMVEDLIRQDPKLEPDDSRKDNIKFVVGEWDKAPALLTSTGYTSSGRILMFETWNNHDSLEVRLYIGPGPDKVREGLLNMVRRNPDVFFEQRDLNASWIPIFTRYLLKPEVYDKLDREHREEEIRRQWTQFLDKDLLRIEAALKKEPWIWEPVEPEDRA
jgi:hypothetical protein